MTSDRAGRRFVMAMGVAFEGGLAGLACLLGWWLDQPPLGSFHWRAADTLLGVAACLPMLAVFFAVVRWPVGPLAGIKQICDDLIRPLLAPCTVLDFAVLSLLAGFGEEMLFRGVLQDLFARWLPAWAAVAAAAAVFGLMHPLSAAYAVLAVLFGLYLGWVYLAGGNLLTAAVAHAAYDFVALVFLVKGPATGPDGGGPEA